MKNRGQLNSLPSFVMALVIVVMVVGVGSLLLSGFKTTGAVIGSSESFNTTIASGLSSFTTLSGFIPLIALAVVAMIVIGLFMGFGRQG